MTEQNPWVGYFKLVEELGELLCELGKLGPFPDGTHPDGKGPLIERIENEMADVRAALHYFATENGLDAVRMTQRTAAKYKQYIEWGLTGLQTLPGGQR